MVAPRPPAVSGAGVAGALSQGLAEQDERDDRGDDEQPGEDQQVRSLGDAILREEQLDAVTALSGSGPAYVFYFMEAMASAGTQMGLPREQAYRLAVATFIGAGELARASDEPPEVLRQRVPSKGGTTYAAITSMDASGVKARFADALFAAQKRAAELGDEFGKD